MRRCAAVLALFAVSLACAPRASGGDPSSGPTISQFLKVRVPGQVRVMSDGTVYFRDFPDGTNQLFKRAPGEPATAQGRKVTSFPDGMASYDPSPDGAWLTVEAAAGGNENNQVYLLNAQTDALTPVLQNPKVQYSVQVWMRDSSGFLYTANEPSPRDFHIYRYDLATKKSTSVLARSGQWFVADVTTDGRWALVSEYRSISDSSMYVMEMSTGNLTDLSTKGAEGTAANTPYAFTTDEASVFFGSDFQNGIVQLYTRPIADPSASPVPFLPALKDRDLDGAVMNLSRSILATVHNEDGYGSLRVFSIPSGAPIAIAPPAPGVVFPGAIEGDVLLYSLSNATTPGVTFAQKVPPPFEKAIPAPAPITARMDQEPVDLGGFRLPELIRFTSFDGLEIPAFLYLPREAKKGSPIPFVVNYHGGPEGQFRPTFDRTVQYLVSQGYGVLQPNVRGSTGYGREFHMMDNYTKRWDSVKDGVEAARWLVKEGFAEPGRIAAYGGSYGGFMAVATVVEGGTLYGASVNVVGLVNLKSFLELTAGYRQKLREVEYGPLSDPTFLLSVSPLERVDEIKVPMMIAHGANDPRVPLNEAIQLAVALQKRGHDPELLFFPDEGHGFQKLENRILFNERMVKFLNTHIGAGRRTP